MTAVREPNPVCGTCGDTGQISVPGCGGDLELGDCCTESEPCPDCTRCAHPAKKRCGICDELYCPGDKCDPYHVEACRDARKL